MTKIVSLLCVTVFLLACKKIQPDVPETISPTDCSGELSSTTEVMGYGILEKLPGIWQGPVYSPTPLGSFPEWIVDLRPVSEAQVSSKNELDSLNDIFMSFFVVKQDCEYKIAFRNGGGFAGMVRNSYMIADSVYESVEFSFYRFADVVSGGNRVYTDIHFEGDSLKMFTYTNQYNSLPQPVLHMQWQAERKDVTATEDAVNHFNYPQKAIVKDFSTTFDGLTEAIFYSNAADPYPESQQPYLGESQVSVSISNPSDPDPAKKVLILITTEPLFNGFTFLQENLKYRSRYVLVGAATETGYLFNYMHPGNYFVNVIYDENGDQTFSSGDYMNSTFDVPLQLPPSGSAAIHVPVNFQIP